MGQLGVPVRVRHERDPYLYFLDISDGTGDFGLKTSEKVTALPVFSCAVQLPSSAALQQLVMVGVNVLCCAADHWVRTAGDRHLHHSLGLRCVPSATSVCVSWVPAPARRAAVHTAERQTDWPRHMQAAAA